MSDVFEGYLVPLQRDIAHFVLLHTHEVKIQHSCRRWSIFRAVDRQYHGLPQPLLRIHRFGCEGEFR